MKCKLSWCPNEAHAIGLCPGHISNYRKYGVPNPCILAHRVGTRTILAKTCPECMELKMAAEFGFQKSKRNGETYIRSMCAKCKVVYNRGHKSNNPKRYENTPERRRAHARYMQDLNDKSRETASKHYEEYTDSEIKTILRTDLSSRQKAAMLHRTVRAINNKLYKLRASEKEAEHAGTD